MMTSLRNQKKSEAEEMDDADVLFSQFFTIVNDLLGDELPEEAIETFLASDGFELFKEVGADPASIDDERRGEFFKIIDEQLGNMPDSSISAFVESRRFCNLQTNLRNVHMSEAIIWDYLTKLNQMKRRNPKSNSKSC